MGFLSKIWKGVKKVVKGAAKAVKKVAKGIVTSTKLGQKLWKEGGRLGKKVLGAVSKIGPLGMMAISVIAPYLAPLWTSFGAAASAAGGFWGSIGTAIYNGANWVGGTLSSMTSGISKGLSTIVEGGVKGVFEGSLSTAGKEMWSGITNAFSGQAGSAAVKQGIVNATATQAAADAVGQSVWKQAGDQIFNDVTGNTVAGNKLSEEAINTQIEQNMQLPEPLRQPLASPAPDAIDQLIAGGNTPASAADVSLAQANVGAALNRSGPVAVERVAGSSLLSKAMDVGKSLVSGFDGEAYQQQYMPIQAGGGQFFRGNASATGGIGSGGGQFLSQEMLQMMQQTQQRMSRGFG